jgi:unsaturated rhamnogalacturonyl hydrolase
VRDQASGLPVVCQNMDLGGDGAAQELVFQADFGPGQTRSFTIEAGQPIAAAPKVYGRLVPERKDDFAWENDRIAFRMYGRRLEDELVSSGVDIWCKRTRSLVIDRWYQLGDYHTDHGEGLDCYKVGPLRGCGGTGVFKDGKLYVSRNFTKARILANGPLRFVFELTYEPWEAGGITVAETKRITLDAGHNLNRFECTFSTTPRVGELPVAIGLGRNPGAAAAMKGADGWLRVWEPSDTKTAGSLGVGVVLAAAGMEMMEAAGHALAVVTADPGKPVVFHAGAGWEKSGDFPNLKAWDDYLDRCAQCLHAPLRVSLSTK